MSISPPSLTATPLTSHCHTPYLPLPHPYLPLPHPLPPIATPLPPIATPLTFCQGFVYLLCFYPLQHTAGADLDSQTSWRILELSMKMQIPMVTSLALPPSPPLLPLLTAPPEVSLMSAVGGSFSHVCVARLAL